MELYLAISVFAIALAGGFLITDLVTGFIKWINDQIN